MALENRLRQLGRNLFVEAPTDDERHYLGVSEITVKVRRSNVMRKMHANSLADLVRMANKLRVSVEKERNLGRSSIAELPGGYPAVKGAQIIAEMPRRKSEMSFQLTDRGLCHGCVIKSL